METLSKNKGIIGAVAVFILVLFLYNVFAGRDTEPLSDGAALPSALGADLLLISRQLSAATLSQELFSNIGYQFLTDFSTPVAPQPVGRANPFEIIGRD